MQAMHRTIQLKQEDTLEYLEYKQTFQSIILSPSLTYVDKSNYIKKILQNDDKIIIFNRPNKWGKSVNCEMIARFLKNQSHQELKLKNMKLFRGGEINNLKLNPLNIFKEHKQFCEQHQCTYPVFDFDFLHLRKQSLQQLKYQIMKILFQKYQQCIDIHKSQNYLSFKTEVKQILQQKLYIQDKDIIYYFLKFVEMLEQNANKKAFILIDNYSSPVQHMVLSNSNNYKQIQDTCYLLSNLVLNMSQSEQKRRIIIFGTYDTFLSNKKIKKSHLFSMQQEFSEFFGLSEQQINDFYLEKLNLNSKRIMKIVKEYYGGYVLQLMSNQNQKNYFKQMYHPYGTIKYLQSCKKQKRVLPGKIYQFQDNTQFFNFLLAKPFEELQYIYVLIDIITDKQEQKIVAGSYTCFPFDPEIGIIQILRQKRNNSKHEQTQLNKSLIAYLFVNYGIMTGDFINFSKNIILYIPNKLIYNILKKQLQDKLRKQDRIRDFSSVKLADKQHFKKTIQKSLNNWRKNMLSKNQVNYHTMIYFRYSLSKNNTHRAYIGENCWNGKIEGVLDNAFTPLKSNSNSTIYIHEYKLRKKQLDDELFHQIILCQIISKGYLNWGIDKSQSNTLISIEYIVLRTIIIEKNEDDNLELNIKDYQITLQSSYKIQRFFLLNKIQKCIIKNKNNYENMRLQILKLCKTNNFQSLLNKIQRLSYEQIDKYFINKQFLHITIQNFNVFKLQKKFPLLKKMNQTFQIHKIFKYSADELKSACSLSCKQAKQLWKSLNQLKDISQYLIKEEYPRKRVKKSPNQEQLSEGVEQQEHK